MDLTSQFSGSQFNLKFVCLHLTVTFGVWSKERGKLIECMVSHGFWKQAEKKQKRAEKRNEKGGEGKS